MVNDAVSAAERGSTLTEALIAGLIVTAIALSFGGAEPAHARGVRQAYEESLALRVAQSTLERARAATADLEPGASPQPVDAALGEQLQDSCCERRVTRIEPGLLEVEATVSWRPRGSEQRTTRRLTTRIATGARR